MKLHKLIMVIFICILLVSSNISFVSSNEEIDYSELEEEKGYWSTVHYSESVIAGFPEYYPLILSIRSQGELPKDLQKDINYTNTVFIDNIIIQSNMTTDRFQNEGGIQRSADSHGKIGADEPFEIKFAINDNSVYENTTAVKFEIRLTPFNMSGQVANDNYDIIIEIKRVGDGDDILRAMLFTVIPMTLIFVEWKLFTKLNSYFIINLKWWKFLLHVYHVKYVHQKLKYKYEYFKSRTVENRIEKKLK